MPTLQYDEITAGQFLLLRRTASKSYTLCSVEPEIQAITHLELEGPAPPPMDTFASVLRGETCLPSLLRPSFMAWSQQQQ
jgi:hypothetical protein